MTCDEERIIREHVDRLASHYGVADRAASECIEEILIAVRSLKVEVCDTVADKMRCSIVQGLVDLRTTIDREIKRLSDKEVKLETG